MSSHTHSTIAGSVSPYSSYSSLCVASYYNRQDIYCDASGHSDSLSIVASCCSFICIRYLFQCTETSLNVLSLESNGVELSVEPLIEWDICRKTKWPELQSPLFSKDTAALQQKKDNHSASASKQEQFESLWLSNVEICTHNPHLRPLWATPQFTFKTFQTQKSEGAESEDQYVFNESIPTRKIEVRHNDPVPFRDG
jgi:hypothetical protein